MEKHMTNGLRSNCRNDIQQFRSRPTGPSWSCGHTYLQRRVENLRVRLLSEEEAEEHEVTVKDDLHTLLGGRHLDNVFAWDLRYCTALISLTPLDSALFVSHVLRIIHCVQEK